MVLAGDARNPARKESAQGSVIKMPVPVTPEEEAYFRERERRPHFLVAGEELMPAGWCGGCETCDRYPAPPDFCGNCGYAWPCPYVGTDVQSA